MLKALAQFIISGSVVVLAGYLSTKLGQKWAGLLVAAPLLTLLTFIFLSLDGSGGNLREYLASALVFMIPAAVFILALLVFSAHLNVMLNILVSLGIYVAVVLAIYKLQTM